MFAQTRPARASSLIQAPVGAAASDIRLVHLDKTRFFRTTSAARIDVRALPTDYERMQLLGDGDAGWTPLCDPGGARWSSARLDELAAMPTTGRG